MLDKDEISNMLTAQSALLDFYGDRAVSHASLFVASIFGLVTVLAIAQVIDYSFIVGTLGRGLFLTIFSLVPYWAFAYAGHHTFAQFKSYAGIAEDIRRSLMEYGRLDKLTVTKEGKDVKLDKSILNEAIKQEKTLFRRYIEKHFPKFYWFLISLLGISVYFPALLRIL